MGHYPGWWWSSTTTSLIQYESLLERERLLAADFDRDVVAIASQPFGITGQLRGAKRHHVPDYLLVGADGTATVVDVKPVRLATRPEVAEILAWTGQHLHERGCGCSLRDRQDGSGRGGAWVMLEGALTDTWDHQLVSAATDSTTTG